MTKDRTAQFLAQMGKSQASAAAEPPTPPALETAPEPEPSATVHAMPRVRKTPAKAQLVPTRAGLKHFGGYLDDETLEKIALLRIRLKMDNSALIKFAIEELDRRHNAKRAFGDV